VEEKQLPGKRPGVSRETQGDFRMTDQPVVVNEPAAQSFKHLVFVEGTRIKGLFHEATKEMEEARQALSDAQAHVDSLTSRYCALLAYLNVADVGMAWELSKSVPQIPTVRDMLNGQ
jgi:hypothetical protein